MDPKKRILYAVFIVLVFFSLTVTTSKAETSELQNKDLIEIYAPVLYFHPEEIFRPQSVEVLVNVSRLRQNRNNWFDLNIQNSVSVSDLIDWQDEDYFLDVWYGAAGESDYKNFSAHRAYYLENLSPDTGGPPVSVYARLVDDKLNQKIIIQYWLFYYYNDWFNKHEGDWELIQIVLDQKESPEWVVLSQHHGGTRRTWESTQVEDGSHPKVFVALGSHANYFWGDEIYPNGIDIGKTRVEILDKTGSVGGIKPEILIMPEVIDTKIDAKRITWLDFRGSWGEQAIQSDFGGPTGPIEKGQQWEDPYTWGISQPLDIDVWYQNRFKLRMDDVPEISIALSEEPNIPASVIDQGHGYFILHSDLTDQSNWIFSLRSELSFLPSIQSYWPSPDLGMVQHYRFAEHSIGINQNATLAFRENGQPFMQIGDQNEINAEFVNRFNATWESPDIIWYVGYLSTTQVITGILISLAAGILPSLIFMVLINNFDKREKEPKSLIAIAFVWGAIPAVLVALFARIFFQIPPDLIGPNAIEAVRTGIFSPLLEEAIKGIIVLFIALRHKKDFNNLLDGLIYGAMVGLGFAMTSNTIGFVGAFLFRGLSSLQLGLFVNGILSNLNHALYTSIFGAGLGLMISTKGKVKRVIISGTAFLLAVLTNGIHGFVAESFVGTPLLVFGVQWVGVGLFFGIMALAIHQEEKVMQDYLRGVISDDFYQIITSKKGRTAYLKTVRQNFDRIHYKSVRDKFQMAAKLAFMIHESKFEQRTDLLEEIKKLKETLSEVELPDLK